MRLRLVLAALALSMVAMLLVAGLWPRHGGAVRPPTETQQLASAADALPAQLPPPPLPGTSDQRVYVSPPVKTPPVSDPLPLISTNGLSAEEIEDAINDRILQLNDLAAEADPLSLRLVLSELTNSLPQIRDAALEALMQAGERDVIPALKEVAANSDDPRQKAQIAKAIDFLTLPSLTEVTAAVNPARATLSKAAAVNDQPVPLPHNGWRRTPNGLQ